MPETYGEPGRIGTSAGSRGLIRGLGVARNEKVGMRWMMLDKIAAHHDHMTVAQRWQGRLERAILQDEQQRLEQLCSQSLESGEAVLAELKRRAGMGEEDEATRLASLP